MRRRYVTLSIVFIGILVLAAIVLGSIYFIGQQRISVFSDTLRNIDESIARNDRLRAEDKIRQAIDSARSEFQFTQLLRRSYQYAEAYNAPGIHFDAAMAAVTRTENQDQRFWAFVVDAALQNSEYTSAMNWAYNNLRHESFQGLVLEAVLRGGGIQSSDGSDFGNFLLMLSRLLDDPGYEDFIAAAIATNDSRYAVNAILTALEENKHQIAYKTYLDFPELTDHAATLILLLNIELGFIAEAESILLHAPPNPEEFFAHNLHVASAEISLRRQRFAEAAELYGEFLISKTSQEIAYNNKLYAQHKLSDFFGSADTALDMLALYPNNTDLQLQFLRWYIHIHDQLQPNPFEPELTLYKQNLEQASFKIPNNDMFSLIQDRYSQNPREYFTTLWLKFEATSDNHDLQRLAFFTAFMFRDEAAMRAVIRSASEKTKNIFRMYYNIFMKDFQVHAEIDLYTASPIDILNAAIMLIQTENYQDGGRFLDIAIDRVFFLTNHHDMELLLSTAWAYHAVIALLGGNSELAGEYIKISDKYNSIHPISQQVKEQL